MAIIKAKDHLPKKVLGAKFNFILFYSGHPAQRDQSLIIICSKLILNISKTFNY